MKRICLLLVILSAALVITACGDADQAGSPDPTPTGVDMPENGGEAVPERIQPNLPERDFEGHEFVILANSADFNSHWFSRDIDAEELTGEAINDAVYHRNRIIEERFNVTIRGAFSGSMLSDARRSILADDGLYDAFSIQMQGTTSGLAQEGMLLDLKNVPYIDLDKPWWDRRANEQLSIGNRLFFTISDLLIIDKDALFIYLFNKDVLLEHGLEDPYQLVRDGTWTIDRMWEMARAVSQDLTGDGMMGDDDRYGLLSQTHTMHGNVVSSGHFVITKDAQDMPVINISHPMILASFEKWIEILNDRSNTWIAQDWDRYHADIWDRQLAIFAEGRGLFKYTGMNRVTMARAMDFNFGILPNPKFDETQASYYNAVHAWCTTAVSIPITADPERTGIILEALTAESFYTLRPAYFDISLTSQLLRDEESGEMLELIFATRVYDLGHVFNWGGVFDLFGDLALARRTDFVSGYERILPRIEAAMQATIDNFAQHE